MIWTPPFWKLSIEPNTVALSGMAIPPHVRPGGGGGDLVKCYSRPLGAACTKRCKMRHETGDSSTGLGPHRGSVRRRRRPAELAEGPRQMLLVAEPAVE